MFTEAIQCLFCSQTILVFMLATISQSATSTSSVMIPDTRNCSNLLIVPTVKTTAYIGWPVSLDCDILEPELGNLLHERSNFFYSEYEMTDGSYYPDYNLQAECQIWDNQHSEPIHTYTINALLEVFDSAYQLPDLQLNHTLKYHIMIKIPSFNSCISTLLDIQAIPLPNLTCEEAVNQTQLIDRKVQAKKVVILNCEVPMSSNPKLSVGQHTPKTHKWLRNCADIPEKMIPSHDTFNAIRISNATYEHPGVYTCAVIHNNQIWYTSHHRVCVEPPTFRHQHAVTCKASSVFATLGQRVEIHCESLVGFRTNSFGFVIQWQKANETKCENLNILGQSREKKSEGSKVTCLYDFTPLPCFTQVPTKEELKKSKSRKMSMTLTIENVQESDLGEYVVTLSNSIHSLSAQARFSLEIDQSSTLTPVYIAIGILVAVLIIIFFSVYTYFCFRRRNRCYLKRKESIEDTSSTITETV